MEIGYNNFDNYDVLRMTGKLEENRRAREVRLSLDREVSGQRTSPSHLIFEYEVIIGGIHAKKVLRHFDMQNHHWSSSYA